MASSSQSNRRQTTEYRRRSGSREGYVYGSAARKLDARAQQQDRIKRERYHAARKNREKAKHMNPGYVLFLALSMLVAGFVLVGYIRLQSEITNSVNNIAKLESQLNDLRLSNDENYNRIQSSVNLDEIKRIAIEELGMTYAAEGQVVEYTLEGSDYVRQVADVPQLR